MQINTELNSGGSELILQENINYAYSILDNDILIEYEKKVGKDGIEKIIENQSAVGNMHKIEEYFSKNKYKLHLISDDETKFLKENGYFPSLVDLVVLKFNKVLKK